MTTPADETSVYTALRGKAEAHLQAGTAPTNRHGVMGIDALRLLHRLSSNPQSADDALKLLHELQVHQVELDLKNEETATHEQRMTEDLDLYRRLFQEAPFGYAVVDLQSVVIQHNIAVAQLLGTGEGGLAGQPIHTFLSPSDQPKLLELLERVAQTGVADYCVAETGEGTQGSLCLQFRASAMPDRPQILLACCERVKE